MPEPLHAGEGAPSPAAYVVRIDRPWLYLRSSTGTLHLRARCWPDDEHGPDGNGLSTTHARCGWESRSGEMAVPGRLFPDGEYRLCRRCVVIEP